MIKSLFDLRNEMLVVLEYHDEVVYLTSVVTASVL